MGGSTGIEPATRRSQRRDYPFVFEPTGAVDGDRTRLNLIDSEVPSQRTTTAYSGKGRRNRTDAFSGQSRAALPIMLSPNIFDKGFAASNFTFHAHKHHLPFDSEDLPTSVLKRLIFSGIALALPRFFMLITVYLDGPLEMWPSKIQAVSSKWKLSNYILIMKLVQNNSVEELLRIRRFALPATRTDVVRSVLEMGKLHRI